MQKHDNTSHATKKNTTTQSSFINTYFFNPTLWHKILAVMLLPLSLLYYCVALFRKNVGTTRDFGIKIISIGNLISGGSGKTPFCIALVKHLESSHYTDIFVILRGYKRHSKGLKEVSLQAKILCDVKQSGDEAMLIAQNIQGSVLVCENREKAIQYALTKQAKIIILDDGYRFRFKKFDILLEPKNLPYFNWVLPSGYYRFPTSYYKVCNLHLKEDRDYIRKVKILYKDFQRPIESHECVSHNTIQHNTHTAYPHHTNNGDTNYTQPRYILATAIANPHRLAAYLPHNVIATYYLPDHAEFDKTTLAHLLTNYHATHILMTQKDYVKCQNFNLPFAILDLQILITDSVLQKIEAYLQQ